MRRYVPPPTDALRSCSSSPVGKSWRAEITSDNHSSRKLIQGPLMHGKALQPVAFGSFAQALKEDLESAADYARAEKSASTQKAYRKDFELFGRWAERHHL